MTHFRNAADSGPLVQAHRFPKVEPVFHAGTQAIRIGSQSIPCAAYMSYFPKPEYYRQIAASGIHLYCIPFFLGDRGVNTFSGIGPFRPGAWVDEDAIDFSAVLGDAEMVLEADPEARLFIRMNLDAPSWWEAAHPEGCCMLSDGNTLRQCFVSPLWRNATAQAIRQALSGLADSGIAEHIIGIHVAAGRTSEWFYHFEPQRGYEDLNPARTDAFRHWLREQYASETCLQDAWSDPAVSFGTAVPASITGFGEEPGWRDPHAEKHTLDTFRFHAESMADTIAFFCKIIKDATGRRLLTGAFYGYHVFLQDPRWGHGALGKLLACSDLDCLASPNAYHRVPGEDWPPMAPIDSVRHHGKLWFAENDTRTHCTTTLAQVAPNICPPGQYADGVWLGPEDPWIARQLLCKNAARMLAGGYGGWWFDMWGGWFRDPQLQDVLQRHRRLADMEPVNPEPMAPEFLVLVDETICHHDRTGGRLAKQLLRHRYAWARIGLPYAVMQASDAADLPAGQFKLIWTFAGPAMESTLPHGCKRLLTRNGAIVCTGPGNTHVDGTDDALFPPDADTGRVAGCLRALARQSGAHLYLDSGDVLHAGHGWLGIHASSGGDKTIRLPFRADITDAIAGRSVGRAGDTFRISMTAYETRLFRLF